MDKKIILALFLSIFLIGFVNAIDITNCTDLQAIESDLTGSYVLTNNISCSDTINWNGGDGFVPISSFSGTFDGQNFTIDSLYINLPANSAVGLFGYTTGSDIKNVGLINVNIIADTQIGGLVGFSEGSNISNSYSTGNLLGSGSVGGLVGDSETDTIISNSYSTANIYASQNGGGLVGYNDGNITNSYATGNVFGGDSVGGLVGRADAGANTGVISNSYSTGNVVGGNDVGGLVGFDGGGTCENSFWDTETSGQLTSACGTGKTTAEMQTESTFTDAGWDFSNTWQMNPTWLYPDLINNHLGGEPLPPVVVQPQSETIGEVIGSSGTGLARLIYNISLPLLIFLIGLMFVLVIIGIAESIVQTFRKSG